MYWGSLTLSLSRPLIMQTRSPKLHVEQLGHPKCPCRRSGLYITSVVAANATKTYDLFMYVCDNCWRERNWRRSEVWVFVG